MAKNKKKGKRTKEPAQKVYVLICGPDIEARETAYVNHLADLKYCLNVIYDAEYDVNRALKAEIAKKKWESYLNCDILPKPHIPPNIRLFFFKMRFFEDETVTRSMDWQLSIDEHSILTQDIDRIDYTRKTLSQKLRPILGDEYDKNIHMSLQVLKLIEYYLDDNRFQEKVSPRVLWDIKELMATVHNEITEFFDRYTYRVISAESSYLDQIDGQTCEYFYNGTDFQIHIWALKNVPILFEFLPQPNMIADFHALDVQIQIPYNVLETNMTIRGLHINFDHYSDHAISFQQEVHFQPDELVSSVPDLYESLLYEWMMHNDLQTKIRNQLLEARRDYEMKLAAIEEEQSKKNKGKRGAQPEAEKKGKKKEKKIKLPKEPMIVPPDCVPDVFEDFLQAEEKQYRDFIEKTYHPNVFKLKSDEINLRKHYILGGVYQFYFVTKALNYNFNTFQMTWHINDRQLIIRDNVFAKGINEDKRWGGSTMALTTRPTMSRSRLNVSSSLPNIQIGSNKLMESPFFIVTFKLPEHMCRWGEPIAAHYETAIGIVEPITEDLKVEETQVVKSPHVKHESPHSILPESETNLVEDKEEVPGPMASLYRMSSEILDRTPSHIFRVTSLSNAGLSVMFGERKSIRVDNFNLDMPLTKLQIRNLQRHCLPRLISSFKFPKEIKMETMDDNPRSKKIAIMPAKVEPDKYQNDRNFEQGEQNNPERMFPIYPKIEHIASIDHSIMPAHNEPDTFYDLINVFDSMRKKNLTKYLKILRLPRFEQRILKSQKIRESNADDSQFSKHKAKRRSSQPKRRSTAVKKPKIGSLALIKTDDISIDSDDGDEEGELKNETNDVIDDSSVSSEDEIKTYKYTHWTREHIIQSSFDRQTRIMTIITDRLGTIGFAFKRYEHFPFPNWKLEPSASNPENEIILTLDTQYVRVILKVTSSGYSGYVTDKTEGFVRIPVIYLKIDEPLDDIKEMKRIFREANVNIFSELDASFYIENGYFSEKHFAAETHTYCCMAINASEFQFMYSKWNRLAKRRDIILNFVQYKDRDSEESIVQARITPEDATFVEVQELCSDNLDDFKLKYTLTWRNLSFYADLHHLILSIFPAAMDTRVKDSKTICFLKNLLCEIRPLSFS